MVSKAEIDRIRSATDLVALVGRHDVTLTRKGRTLIGLCPFHADTSPSLVVNPEKQLWNCLGACSTKEGKSGGDVFAFLMKAEGIGFLEAVTRLGRNGGPPHPATTVAEQETDSPLRPELLGRVVERYHSRFRECPEGQEYLKHRGLTDPKVLEAFQVGYADGTLVRTLDTDGEAAGSLRTAGVLNARGREHFFGCVVFPLTLPDLGVVGLYGRHVRESRHLYLPGPRRGVFHWQALKSATQVILTESILDALTLYHAGFRNVCAVYGTNGFTADHEELLRRFRVRRVCLYLDNDEAGSQATETIGARIRRLGIDVLDARVPGAKDPNELFLRIGPEPAAEQLRARMAELQGRAKRSSSSARTNREADEQQAAPDTGPRVRVEDGGGWFIEFPKRSYRVRGVSPKHLDRLRVNLRVRAERIAHLDTLDLYSHRARTHLVEELAKLFGHAEKEIEAELAQLIDTLEEIRLDLIRGKGHGEDRVEVEISDRDREAALELLRAPDLLERVLSDFERIGCVGERAALTIGYLGVVSRLLDDPLGLLIVSRSGAGKSSLQGALCDFVPEKHLAKYTRVTGQALFYKDENSLRHKVLSIEEEKGAEDAAYSIRNLQSAQELTIAATRTDPSTGKLRTEEYRVNGPVFIMLTTTSVEALDYETRTRFVQVGIDESQEQTRRILERQRELDTLDGVLRREEATEIRKKQQNLQRLLRPLKVVNPYAPYLRYPDERLQMRREQKKYLTLIKAIALLHQHGREIRRARSGEVEVEYVEVIPSDIELANGLAPQILGRSLDELAHPTRELLKRLVEWSRNRGTVPFTRKDVREATGWSNWQVRTHLRQLEELEYVVQTAGGRGKLMTYELMFDGDADEDKRYLAGLVNVAEVVRLKRAAEGRSENRDRS